jgi:hypothetical protein
MTYAPHHDWETDDSPRYLKVRVENWDGDCTQCGCATKGDLTLRLECDRIDVPDYWLCRSCAQHFAIRVEEVVKYQLGIDTTACGHERKVHSSRSGTLANTGPCMHCERCVGFSVSVPVARTV